MSPVKRSRLAGTRQAAAFATLFFPSSAQATLRRPEAVGTALAWAADRESAGARRGLQIALGVLWLLDAALQYQPYMFGKGFITRVLAPTTIGNPGLIASPAMAAARLIGQDVAAWNALFATTQLALAAGLLWRRTARAALAATIAWSLAVWWLGEGLPWRAAHRDSHAADRRARCRRPVRPPGGPGLARASRRPPGQPGRRGKPARSPGGTAGLADAVG